MIKIIFFARLRDELNCSELNLEIKDINNEETITVIELLEHLFKLHPQWQNTFDKRKFFTAINQDIVQNSHQICNGDEVAFFPPVTGG
jgi:molybdopterin synthase sulfur carrier subunit